MPLYPWDKIDQPADNTVAGSPWFYVDTYREFQRGLEALLAELERHRKVVEFLELTSSPYEEEVGRIARMVEWGKERLDVASLPKHAEITVNGVTFGSLRYLKAGILYQAFLVQERRREFLANSKLVPRSVLKSFDLRIEQLQNIGEMGKLNGLRPADVLFELLEADKGMSVETATSLLGSAPALSPSITIVDPILRTRCVTILAALEDPGKSEQFDTVIREMSVVLEDRVRELTGFVGKASGAELFSATMGREPYLIRFSPEKDIQEAAHLFFRGYSGLVRNEVMHRLVTGYTKERVSQLLGIVDYMLFLISKAEIRKYSSDC